MNERAAQTIVTFFPAPRRPAPLPRPERAREPGDDAPYVTADVASRDRREVERLALIGFLHVGA